MTALLDPRIGDKLAKLCGMFGSDHAGERANAAEKAHKLVHDLGLTWQQVITIPAATPSIEELIDYALFHGDDIVNAWEEGFLRGVRGREFLTEKQLAKLADILVKVRAYAGAVS